MLARVILALLAALLPIASFKRLQDQSCHDQCIFSLGLGRSSCLSAGSRATASNALVQHAERHALPILHNMEIESLMESCAVERLEPIPRANLPELLQ